MLEFIAKYWLEAAMGVMVLAIGGLATYVRQRFARAKGENKAIKRGLCALLYINLKQASHQYHIQGWISIHDHDDVEETYEAYHALGGNGTGTVLWKDINKLPKQQPGCRQRNAKPGYETPNIRHTTKQEENKHEF